MTTTTATGTTSYPAVGLNGVSAAAWAETFGSRDGLVEDYTGTALSMTLLDATNEAQFTAANISNNGYTLKVPEGLKIGLPAPSSGSTTYYIGSLYDPALQVADGSGNAVPEGPCRLVASDGPPDLTNGKRFLVQWIVTRTTAALSSAVVTSQRRWVGTVGLDFADGGVGATDASLGNEGLYPRGTIRVGTDRLLLRTLNTAGTGLTWRDPLADAPTALPLLSAFVARNTNTPATYYRHAGNMISFQGQIRRTSGNLSTGSDVVLGTMPQGRRPAHPISRICKCGGTNNYAEVRVNSDNTTDGQIIMTDPNTATTWVDLSAITYRIGA